ncbi:MAG TPA: GNAT family N-acetyltransferase [Mycobacteriales bacterium]|jgi:GNAT superfamily N-acetyltransferase|nr:GNAT family N-acetyltransferase [Mycobacteriales bacterium]
MQEASRTVRLIGRNEATLLGEILADAFAEDPVFQWLIDPNVRNRDQRMRMFFTSMSRSYLRQAKPCYISGDGSAAAMWAAPGKWALPMSEMALEAAPQTAAFGRRLQRALRTQLQIEGLHPKSPKHWYLGYLGARQENQGQGFGSQLLREVLSKADADGVPAYLESSNERNVPLYERHGFKVVEEVRALGKGPLIWRMWRDPAT